VCYHLYLASPLTLSEVRAMLPPGLSAALVDPEERQALRRADPDAQIGARLMHGACSCDLLVERRPVSREDESWLRRRYREQGLSRGEIIAALERHRRAQEERTRAPGHWPRAVAAFVAEHARNAGATLYYLRFSHDGKLGPLEGAPVRLTAQAVRDAPGQWLEERRLTMVDP
jgi:hypothetical protein